MNNQDSIAQNIFNIIKSHGPISRVEIHNDYGIRKATVTTVTQKFMEKNYLSEVGEVFHERGRKPVLLTLNDSAFNTIGIQVRRSEIKVGVYSNGGIQRYALSVEVNCNMTNDELLATLKDAFTRTIQAAKKHRLKVRAVGVALPGIVNVKEGVFVYSDSFPAIKQVPIVDALESCTNLPVYIDNDVVCMSLAERAFGEAKRSKNYAVVFIGEGIGCRLILDGHIHRGEHNKAGELGHMPVVIEGHKCTCGRSGCLETIASIPAILKRFPKAESFEALIQQAEDRDQEAISLLDEVAAYIGKGLIYIYDLLDISLIFLTGPVTAGESFLMPAIQKVLTEDEKRFVANVDSRRVLFSRLGQEAGVKGAALLAAAEVFARDGLDIFQA